MGKCKGLWLGGWSGRDDPPLDLQWSSAWVKVLGVFIGPSDLEEENWRPRIAAVENCLKAWRLRRLSFRGRAVVVNALALSRIWYVASLIPMPVWVLASLNRLIFPFVWGGKADLVTRDVVIQSPDFGGFSLVSVHRKVWALHVQWVGRFVRRFSAWMQFLFYYTRVLYGSTPGDLLSYPRRVDFSSLPPFYQAVLSADTLVVASSSVRTPVSAVSTKSTYSLLLEFHRREPACVVSFGRVFGPLYWPSTWAQLFWFSLDCPVIDVSWKIAHGVLRTGQRLVSTFGMSHIPIACFCNPLSTESLEHLFFSCPLAQAVLSWLRPSCPAVLPSFRLCCVDMYCLALTVTNFVSSLVGLCICSMCASISCGRPVTIIVSETSFPVLVPCVLRCVLGFVFTFPCSSSVSVRLVAVAILFASGVLVALLLPYWMVG